MPFSTKQIEALSAPLFKGNTSERQQGGKKFTYIEAWWAIHEANGIFGFDAWDRETIDMRCVVEKPRVIGESKKDGWGVSYIAKVRITVGDIVREGTGAGHGIDVDLGLAHESAIKEAESDAMKRALTTFGNPFGLALYDKDRTEVTSARARIDAIAALPAQEAEAAPAANRATSAETVVELKAENPVTPAVRNAHTLDLGPGEKLTQWTDRYVAALARCATAEELAALKAGNQVLLTRVLASTAEQAKPSQEKLRNADEAARKRVAEGRPTSAPTTMQKNKGNPASSAAPQPIAQSSISASNASGTVRTEARPTSVSADSAEPASEKPSTAATSVSNAATGAQTPKTPYATLVDPEAFIKDAIHRMDQCETMNALDLVWMRDIEPMEDKLFPSDYQTLLARYRLRHGSLGGNGE
jgi:recombination DNA repair RAD52 pathway protein